MTDVRVTHWTKGPRVWLLASLPVAFLAGIALYALQHRTARESILVVPSAGAEVVPVAPEKRPIDTPDLQERLDDRPAADPPAATHVGLRAVPEKPVKPSKPGKPSAAQPPPLPAHSTNPAPTAAPAGGERPSNRPSGDLFEKRH
jgi:hypothetical protein